MFLSFTLSDQPHAVEILISRGSEVNPRDKYGQTPLHLACYNGYLHTVELLLGHNGIDANVLNNKCDTPLHVAVQKRNNELVSLLLNQGSVQLDIQNNQKRTPIA
ncbi:putative ankyrin repeat protein RF_0580 [Octopus sinensis]|uniref:Ankyrin repeat protein RF_0580 n=1 Tax=Octopus sinensis TaxID=2607531 RepID=A0A6P7TZQ3_9MOLL|nr:putative ankyrin repeat protein RF_0580 [Octopus sinensis]